MELLVKAINKSGGDIFKFAGDAMIALWPNAAGGN
jgi:adenylate cyclase 10